MDSRQKNEFEWNLLNDCEQTDVLMMRYTYLEVRIVLFGSTHIMVGATMFYPTTIYDSHYVSVVRHNIGKIDYVLK